MNYYTLCLLKAPSMKKKTFKMIKYKDFKNRRKKIFYAY